jgi:catechol 2,3-dioxygenase-like lactoylglutathione lyase family enzyme
MKLRVARHTINLERIIWFYCDLLGLEVLGKFEDHDGYNGVFLGLKNTGWHLEFTTSAHPPQHEPDEDDLLVFYQQSAAEYEALKHKLETHNATMVTARNPYWDTNGCTYLDPDGYRVVIALAGTY